MFGAFQNWLALPLWSVLLLMFFKRHSIRSLLRMSLSALDRVLWKRLRNVVFTKFSSVALCSSLQFVLSLCSAFVPVGQI